MARLVLPLLLLPLLLQLQVAALPFTTLTYADRAGDNTLFRGPEQIIGDWFAYDWLRFCLRLEADERRQALPEHYEIIDYCLLNDPAKDARDEAIEAKYFRDHPTHGAYVHWSTNGTRLDPANRTLADIRARVANWTAGLPWIDPLPQWTEALRAALAAPHAPPRALYVHCKGGKDRTGEVMGSYAMRYLNMTYPEARAWDEGIAGRPIGHGNDLAMQWMCWWLVFERGYDHDQLGCPA